MGGSVNSVKKNAAVILVASKGVGIEVNADKTNYMVMSRVQNAEISHNIDIDNICFENVEQCEYLRTSLTKQNSIQEEIKFRL